MAIIRVLLHFRNRRAPMAGNEWQRGTGASIAPVLHDGRRRQGYGSHAFGGPVMFVLVEHYVSDVRTFWSAVRHALPARAELLRLHHCFPTPDGTHAVCVWEAESLRDVRAFLETYVGHASRNLYFPVENGEGIALPSGVSLPDEAVR